MIIPKKLQKVADRYNAFLEQTVGVRQKLGRSHPEYIFNLRDFGDRTFLQEKGYGVDLVDMNVSGVSSGSLIDGETSEWIKESLRAGKIDYRRSCGEVYADPTLVMAIQAPKVQRGICVVGRNYSDDEFETHMYGNEGLVPTLFHGLTLITRGIKLEGSLVVNADCDARAVFMPVNPNLMYILNGQSHFSGLGAGGHYAPHVLAIMNVFLPDMTNHKRLTPLENALNSQLGNVAVARNKLLASRRGEGGTAARVTGEKDYAALHTIREVQNYSDQEIVPRLLRALR